MLYAYDCYPRAYVRSAAGLLTVGDMDKLRDGWLSLHRSGCVAPAHRCASRAVRPGPLVRTGGTLAGSARRQFRVPRWLFARGPSMSAQGPLPEPRPGPQLLGG